MKTQKIQTSTVIYSLLGLFLLLGLWFIFKEKPLAVETVKVIKGPFIQTLRVDGTIKARKKITVSARATGDLGRVDFKVGQEINKNQIISQLKWDYSEKVRSPIKGVISKVYRESAGPINRGDPIIDIINPNDLEIESEVLTTDAVRIPSKAQAKIYGIGNDAVFEGQVSKVSRAGFIKISALGIEEEKTQVYITFKDIGYQIIGDNFHVELQIIIDSETQALKIPLGALFKIKNQWTVFTVANNRAHLRRIHVSKRNDTEAVIKQVPNFQESLQEGETVILFPGDQISDGTLIKSKESQ